MHFNVTRHPTERWTAQQIVEAFPYESPPRYLIRDQDSLHGSVPSPFRRTRFYPRELSQHLAHRMGADQGRMGFSERTVVRWKDVDERRKCLLKCGLSLLGGLAEDLRETPNTKVVSLCSDDT